MDFSVIRVCYKEVEFNHDFKQFNQLNSTSWTKFNKPL